MDLFASRAGRVLEYLDVRIDGCEEPGCSAFQTYQGCHPPTTKDYIDLETHTSDDFILTCQDSECDDPIYACTQHAYKYLLHSTNDHWFCKDCFKKDENEVLIVHISIYMHEGDTYTYTNVKDKKLCTKKDCICKKNT